MIDLGPHSAFIIAAYGFAALALIVIFAWIMIDLGRQTRLVARLEAAREDDKKAAP